MQELSYVIYSALQNFHLLLIFQSYHCSFKIYKLQDNHFRPPWHCPWPRVWVNEGVSVRLQHRKLHLPNHVESKRKSREIWIPTIVGKWWYISSSGTVRWCINGNFLFEHHQVNEKSKFKTTNSKVQVNEKIALKSKFKTSNLKLAIIRSYMYIRLQFLKTGVGGGGGGVSRIMASMSTFWYLFSGKWQRNGVHVLWRSSVVSTRN